MTYEAVLTALADPTRRQIFERVLSAPQPVGVIADGLPVSRPAVSAVESGGTTVTQSYVVGGYIRGGIEAWAPRVDRVLDEALQHLKNFLEGKTTAR